MTENNNNNDNNDNDMVDSTQSLYIPREKGRRGLISIEDWVELAIRGLEVCIDSFDERLIQATIGDKIDGLGVSSSRIVF